MSKTMNISNENDFENLKELYVESLKQLSFCLKKSKSLNKLINFNKKNKQFRDKSHFQNLKEMKIRFRLKAYKTKKLNRKQILLLLKEITHRLFL